MMMKHSRLAAFIGLFIAGNASATGSIVIDDNWITQNGSTVTGTFNGSFSTPAISVITKKPVTIRNSTLTGQGDLIRLAEGTDVSVINTRGTVLNPGISGESNGSFVRGTKVASLTVKNCTVEGGYFGVYIDSFTGNTIAGQSIKILNNVFNNIDGRSSDGNGSYQLSGYPTQPMSHAIQLNGVQNVPNIEIAWNQIVAAPYQSLVSDIISIYSSSGTKAGHLLVHDNYIQGAMGPLPGNGATYSGGGIVAEGSAANTALTAPAYVDIYNNQVTMTAGYGLAIRAGHDNNIYNNRVVSAGLLPCGALYAMDNAVAAANINPLNQPTSVFFNNHVHDNTLGLIRKNPGSSPTRSDWLLTGQAGDENNLHFSPNVDTRPSVQDEMDEWISWGNKLKTNNILVGVQNEADNGTLVIVSASGSDAQCGNASDILYLDNSTMGIPFKVSTCAKQTLAVGTHPLVVESTQKPIPAGDGTTATCTGAVSVTQAQITAGTQTTVPVIYTYHAPVTTGTLTVSAAADSDAHCLGASDTVYIDGTSAGSAFTVSAGFTSSVPAGLHQLTLASGSADIPAGGGNPGTCSSTFNHSTGIKIVAGQTTAVTASYRYNAVSTMACTVTNSVVTSTQLWDVKVDGFHEEITLTGFPVDQDKNITLDGTMVMKNQFRLNFWSSQALTYAFTGSTGKFTGKIYAPNGSATLTLDGYLADGTPAVLQTGDHPLKSLMINSIPCTVAFPLRLTVQ